MRGKRMVEMCQYFISKQKHGEEQDLGTTSEQNGVDIVEMYQNFTSEQEQGEEQDLGTICEQNRVEIATLIEEAEIIFDNDLSSSGLDLCNDHCDIVENTESTINQDNPVQLPNNADKETNIDDNTENKENESSLIFENINEHVEPFAKDSHIDTSENDQSDEEPNTSTTSCKAKRKINKERRMKGKAFTGFRRPRNQKRTFQDVERDERRLGVRCTSEVCRKSSKRKCSEITEATRNQIFAAFWNELNWEQRKVYVANLVSKQETQRKTKADDNPSRRSSTLFYRLNVGETSIPVCKNMFLKTLGLKEWSVKSWVEKSRYGILPNAINTDQRFSPRTTQNDNIISTFLDKLPKLPSHYCRKDTKKLYLEQDFCTYSDLYKAYVKYSEEENVPPATRNTLIKWVQKMNIGIFKPRKDLCDTCVEFESGNLSQEEWEKHRKDKERAQKEKSTDKEKAIDNLIHVVTVDLQAVKTCPYLQASSLYFKTKLVCHNYTVYDLSTHHCSCYWFSEIDADLQASTFASLIVDYLKRKYLQDPESKKDIVIYSDGCTYQNRNSTLANALLSLSLQYSITITQKFLVKGHSQMECDSVHATIEKKLKNKNIEIPNDYYRLTKEARQKPFPYEVVCPGSDFFKNFNSNIIYNSIRPGKKTTDPTVTSIRALRYENGIISYTLDFDQAFKPLPHRPKTIVPNKIEEFPQLFPNRLSITKKKYDDLQSIKTKLNQNYWPFYDSLLIS